MFILIGQILIILLTPSLALYLQQSCWSSQCMLWWELPGLSSITSHALMSLPKTWLWVSERVFKGENWNGHFRLKRGLLCLNVNNVLIFSAGIVACNWLVIFSVCITLMCTFDPTGRTFVKLKATRRRQRNLTTYTLRYQALRSFISLSVFYFVLTQNSTKTQHQGMRILPVFHTNSFCVFLPIRHRLEEGQASSWSRRLKFFMCCTRAQDTQSVSHNTHLPVSSLPLQ